MRTIKRCIALFMAVISTIYLFGCSKTSTTDFTCFNTGIHVEVTGKSLNDELQLKIKDTLYSLEEKFSVKDGSFTKNLNDSATGTLINLDTETKQILLSVKNLYEFTDKKFNPAVYPLVKLWQFSPNFPVENFTLPNNEDITALTNDQYLNLNNLVIDESNMAVTKTSDLELDFGGILKGYATEKVYKILSDAGYEKGYVNIGGSSLKILSANTLAIRHPENVTDNVIRVDTKNQADFSVSTSGTYERFYTLDGKKYSHIIDPFIGKPTDNNILSATVVGTNGAFGDAVTTALCLLNFNKNDVQNCSLTSFMNKILSRFPNASIFVVYNDGDNKFIITNKESETFTLLDDTYSVIKI